MLIQLAGWPVIAIAALAGVIDAVRGRIYNWLTFPAILAGLAYAGATAGLGGLGHAALGCLAGGLLFGWMFALGVMGGGDVKLLMAFGAWGGPKFATEIALLSIMLGGVLALGSLLVRKRAADFARRVHRFFLTAFVKELELEPLKIDHSSQMPFGVPMAVAAIWIVLDNPFLRYGVLPW